MSGLGDIVTTWGLDSQGVEHGVRGVERTLGRASESADKYGERSEKTFKKTFKEISHGFLGFLGAREIIGYASEALGDYAKKNETVAMALAASGKAGEEFKNSLGRDLSLLAGPGGPIEGLIGGLGKVREFLVNRLGDNLRGLFQLNDTTSEGITNLQKADDESAQRSVGLREASKAYAEVRAIRAAIAGDEYHGKMEAEAERHKERLQEIEKTYKDLPGAIQPAKDGEEAKHKALVDQIEDEKKRRDQAGKLDREQIEDQVTVAAYAAQMRARGFEEEARHEEIRADYARRREAAENEGGRTAEEKAAKVAAINRAERAAQDAATEAVRQDREEHARGLRGEAAASHDSVRATLLELDGHKERAELLRIELDYQKQLQRLNEDKTLGAGDRAALSEDAKRDRDRLLRGHLTRQAQDAADAVDRAARSQSFRTIAPGLFDSFTAQAALGSGRSALVGPAAPSELELATARQTEVLEAQSEILDGIRTNTLNLRARYN